MRNNKLNISLRFQDCQLKSNKVEKTHGIFLTRVNLGLQGIEHLCPTLGYPLVHLSYPEGNMHARNSRQAIFTSTSFVSFPGNLFASHEKNFN